MQIGACPRCQRPYTASEVVGLGILRSRYASAGGPRVEFTCPDCDWVVQLIPYGKGRYAPPGEPPPLEVPEEARRPPWARTRGSQSQGASRRGPKAPGPEPSANREGPADPAPPPHQAEPIELEAPEIPMGPAEALEILGVAATAAREEIERAFRERSLTCHPDKVAHLDREFQELAEEKFKRLRRALDLLTS